MPAATVAGPEALQQQKQEITFGRESNPMMLAWFEGEFAAANAIIDALCSHIAQIAKMQQEQCAERVANYEYEEVFSAIYKRRLNWIPVLHMQKYFSIADISIQLQNVLENKKKQTMEPRINSVNQQQCEPNQHQQESVGCSCCCSSCSKGEEDKNEQEKPNKVVLLEEDHHHGPLQGHSPDQNSTTTNIVMTNPPEYNRPSSNNSAADTYSAGSVQEDTCGENLIMCRDHEECLTRRERINILKGFVAKEAIKGHMVNVVKGMKVYEGVFTDPELLKLGDYIKELRSAGRRGELPGETYIFFNKELKGNKREIIQLGVPLYEPASDATSSIVPIPPILQDVIHHLLQWRLLPQSKRPNSCIINFFDEGEYSQPYFKPPHLDNPISSLFLHETTMAFGRALTSDNSGSYRGTLSLSLKEGSFLVLRGNSADKARHVVCPSANARVSVTFTKVRSSPFNQHLDSAVSPTKAEMASLWMPEESCGAYGCSGLIPSAWGVAMPAAPFLMLAPSLEPVIPTGFLDTSITTKDQMTDSIQNVFGGNGTGVYLPWTMGGSKKYLKQIPPRFQKRKLPVSSPSLSPPSQIKQVTMVKAASPITAS